MKSKRTVAIPFSAYPQFRNGDSTQCDVDLMWREATILNNRMALSIMPLLTDELIFDSFCRHEVIWKSIPCEIFSRDENLHRLLDEYDEKYAHLANNGDSPSDRRRRAAFIEKVYGQRIGPLKVQSAQDAFKGHLTGKMSEVLRQDIHKGHHEAIIEALKEISLHKNILDHAASMVVLSRHGLAEFCEPMANLAYYKVGAAQIGGFPIVPFEHLTNVDEPYRRDLLSEIVTLAMRGLGDFKRLPSDFFMSLPLEGIVELSETGFAKALSQKLRALAERVPLGNMSIEEVRSVLLDEIVSDLREERDLIRRYDSAKAVSRAIGWVFGIGAFLEPIHMMVNVGERIVGPYFNAAPAMFFTNRIREIDDRERIERHSANSTSRID